MPEKSLTRDGSVGSAIEELVPELVVRATEARAHAYAPYSRFRVGAAVLGQDGRVAAGANVENASYGLTMCAERVALFGAISQGSPGIVALALSAEPAVWPCGACLQVLAEFARPDCAVVISEGGRVVARSTLGALLPHAFGAAFLRDGHRG
ncbi:MAG: cytidine deaminase [Anaerolineae bacterium]|nr:cytidine deaminase [Anaerolineae bacterium]